MTSTDVLWRNLVRTDGNGLDAAPRDERRVERRSLLGPGAGLGRRVRGVPGVEPASYVMFGLSHGDTDAGYADVDYAIYTYPPTGRVMVYRGWGVPDHPGQLRGERHPAGGRGRRSGDVLGERGASLQLLDAAHLPAGDGHEPVLGECDGVRGEDGRRARGGELKEIVSWTHLNGVEVTGDALTRPVAGGWTAGAISSRRIATGSGGAEYAVADMASYVMFGLSHGDTDGSYADIDYALYTYPPTGQVMVFENGVYRGQFGAYVPGDRLRVSVEDGVVSYWKNESLLYTSLTAPTYPLILDVSLYAGRIEGARLTGNLSSVPIIEESVAWTNLVNVTDSGRDAAAAHGGGLERGGGLDARDRVDGRLRGAHGGRDERLPDAGPVERRHGRPVPGHRLRSLPV